MKKLLSMGLVLIGLLTLPTLSHAQLITWTTATDMDDDSDISNIGTAFDAGTFYGTATAVNGVTFNTLASSGGGYTDGKISINTGNIIPPDQTYTKYTGGSADYQNVVSTLIYTNSGVGTGMTISLDGLTIGDTYQVQVLAYDGRLDDATRGVVTQLSGGTAPNGLLTGSTSPTAPQIGQYVFGTFTATSTSFSFDALQTQNYAVISDVSVRNLGIASVPEPSSRNLALIVGLALAAVIVRRRLVSGC